MEAGPDEGTCETLLQERACGCRAASECTETSSAAAEATEAAPAAAAAPARARTSGAPESMESREIVAALEGRRYSFGAPGGARHRISLRKKEDQSLGLELDLSSGTFASVVRVKPGVVAEYNSQVSDPSTAVKPGDCIMEANGAKGTADKILARLRAHNLLSIEIQRPKRLEVTIPTSPGRLGLQLHWAPSGVSLYVGKIEHGRVAAANHASEVPLVCVGDRILSVDGQYSGPSISSDSPGKSQGGLAAAPADEEDGSHLGVRPLLAALKKTTGPLRLELLRLE